MKNTRRIFTATFIRRGVLQSFKSYQRKVLLKNVKDSKGLIIEKELWVNDTKSFTDLKTLKYGDRIEFTSNFDEYNTTNGPKREFSRINNVKILVEDEGNKSHLNKFNDDINAILDSL